MPYVFPRVIWTYWDAESLSPIAEACIATWTRWNPTYSVNVLTPSTVGKYLVAPFSSVPWVRTPQLKSDFVRMCVLAKCGGVWSDATVFCTGPFPAQMYLDAGAHEFVGYRITTSDGDPPFPVLESWWFAACVGSVFMAAWARAFTTASSPEAGTRYFREQGTAKLSTNTYFFIYSAAQFALQKGVGADFIRTKMKILGAEERGGPMWFRRKWSMPTSISVLFEYMERTNRARAEGRTHVFQDGVGSAPCLHKLTGKERQYVEVPGRFGTFKRLLLDGWFPAIPSPPVFPPTPTRVLNVFIHPPPPTLAPGLWKQGDAHETRALQAWQEQNPAWKCVRTTLASSAFIDGSKGLWVDATPTVMGLVMGGTQAVASTLEFDGVCHVFYPLLHSLQEHAGAV